MTRARRNPRIPLSATMLASVVVAIVIGPSGAAVAQDRETVGTKVSAEGDGISIKWDKRHPWDQQLSSRGAELFAEYRSESRGLVAESLGRATSRGDDREFRFTLPETVRSIPAGEVCLYVQPLGGRTLLPLRRSTGQRSDTARFRYQPWEQLVRARAESRAAESRIELAQAEVATAARRVAGQEAVLAKRGWSEANACRNIVVGRTEAPPKPYDVVAPAEQDEMARRVCVHRVWHGREVTARYISGVLAKAFAEPDAQRNLDKAKARLGTTYGDAFFVPEAAGPLLDQLRNTVGADDSALRARAEQAAEFLRDWNRLSPTIAAYDPHLGGREDVLPWPRTAKDVAFRVLGPTLAAQLNASWVMEGEPAPTVRDIAGVIGAALDAYTDCVKDGSRQLAIKSTAWDALEAQLQSGERTRQLQEFFGRECRQETGTLDELRTTHGKLQTELTRLQEVLAKASASSTRLPQNAQILNFVTCGQR